MANIPKHNSKAKWKRDGSKQSWVHLLVTSHAVRVNDKLVGSGELVCRKVGGRLLRALGGFDDVDPVGQWGRLASSVNRSDAVSNLFDVFRRDPSLASEHSRDAIVHAVQRVVDGLLLAQRHLPRDDVAGELDEHAEHVLRVLSGNLRSLGDFRLGRGDLLGNFGTRVYSWEDVRVSLEGSAHGDNLVFHHLSLEEDDEDALLDLLGARRVDDEFGNLLKLQIRVSSRRAKDHAFKPSSVFVRDCAGEEAELDRERIAQPSLVGLVGVDEVGRSVGDVGVLATKLGERRENVLDLNAAVEVRREVGLEGDNRLQLSLAFREQRLQLVEEGVGRLASLGAASEMANELVRRGRGAQNHVVLLELVLNVANLSFHGVDSGDFGDVSALE